MHVKGKWFTAAFLVATCMSQPARFAAAQTYTRVSLYDFQNGTDGSAPQGLLRDPQGNLYGTASGGSGPGVLFKLDRFGNFSVLHNFTYIEGYPGGLLARDAAGNLYGSTTPNNVASGWGRVWKFDTSNTFSVLHVFASRYEGFAAYGGLTVERGVGGGPDYLYGTTSQGGDTNCGNVFKLDTSGSNFMVLHSFNWAQGCNPYGPVLPDGVGHLYGTTYMSDRSGGILFKIDTSGANFQVLYGFPYSDGYPTGGLALDAGGWLYGTTRGNLIYAGGVFKFDTATGAFEVLHRFGGADGAHPWTTLALDSNGRVFGVTGSTLFRIDSSGANFTVLDATPTCGGLCLGGNVAVDSTGAVFGASPWYGANNNGAIFKVTVVNDVTDRVRVNAGPVVYNRGTNRYTSTTSLTNTGGTTLTGPLYLFLKDLPAGVTLPDLPTHNGVPYATFPVSGGLAPGATSGTLTINFADPSNTRITYKPQVFDGSY